MKNLIVKFLLALILVTFVLTTAQAGPAGYAACVASCMGKTLWMCAAACAAYCAPTLLTPDP